MNELCTFRTVLVEVKCPDWPEPMTHELATTLSDRELIGRGMLVAAERCVVKGAEHWRVHTVTVTEIPETSTGARRG